MDGSAESMTAVATAPPPSSAAELARALGVSPEVAERLWKAGLTSVEAVRDASSTALEQAGLAPEEVARVHSSGTSPAERPAPGAVADSERIVERWVGTVRRPERAKRRRVTVTPKESTSVLRKWVDGDDRAMEDWIRSSEPVAPGPTPPEAPTPTAAPE
jgi:hypothetical protein